MERDELVVRRQDEKDRRKVWVRLTAKGEELFGVILSAYEEEFVPLMDYLSQEEPRQLSHLLKKVIEGISRDRE